ncbi:MAG TPA: quinone-dependent dihydroorotate dehydrogenase [Roseiflexaceae bacterium]|nr:quinone-dependent dihydroorotate dehydrogenase [Roseiflexaceae bacterium]
MIYQLLKPLLFRLDAERAHDLVSGLLGTVGRTPLAAAALRALCAYEHPALQTTCAGLPFRNPVGLAAGFDKRAALIKPMALLGFGHLEVGTVTPRPQPGNPQPRMFRLPEDRALINRLGFNSPGLREVAARLRAARRPPLVVGVNIGKNRDTPLERATEDYAAAFVALAPLADYVTVNISSPNTPGLRLLHERAALEELLGALARLNQAQPRPLLLKVSPDETPAQLDQVVAAAMASGADGFVATNTTLGRDGLRGTARGEAGGLSGQPLTERARAVIAHLADATGGRLPIIGVGGVANAAEAYGHIRAGAALVQLYTGMIYQGPGVVRSIKRGLVELLQRDGYREIGQAVGADRQLAA